MFREIQWIQEKRFETVEDLRETLLRDAWTIAAGLFRSVDGGQLPNESPAWRLPDANC